MKKKKKMKKIQEKHLDGSKEGSWQQRKRENMFEWQIHIVLYCSEGGPDISILRRRGETRHARFMARRIQC